MKPEFYLIIAFCILVHLPVLIPVGRLFWEFLTEGTWDDWVIFGAYAFYGVVFYVVFQNLEHIDRWSETAKFWAILMFILFSLGWPIFLEGVLTPLLSGPRNPRN